MPIRAVITDFGGVLFHTPDRRWLRRWQVLLGLGKDEFITAIIADPEESEYVRKIYTGEVTEAEVLRLLAARWHLQPWMITRLRSNGFSKKRYNREMAGFIQGLRPRYRTAILSNAGDQGRKTFNDAYALERLVDMVIISAEEKLAKPDERIYSLALDRLGVGADEAIFIDDLAINIQAARQMGIRSVQFSNTAQAIAEVNRHLEEELLPVP
jgi:epoxide hydrolase-like predicted phosphatase